MYLNWDSPIRTGRISVVGEDKTATITDNKLFVDGEPVDIPSDEPLRLECQDFIRCINTRGTPIASGYEGLEVVRVLEACDKIIHWTDKDSGDWASDNSRP